MSKGQGEDKMEELCRMNSKQQQIIEVLEKEIALHKKEKYQMAQRITTIEQEVNQLWEAQGEQ